jgi:hypothetical protein
MDNILSKIILRNWGGIRLNANIDEELEDIDLAILYNDHGDDFLLIRTKDNTYYEYGWWLNRERHFYPKYDDLYNGTCDWKRWFVRRPELLHKIDNNSEFSNRIHREFYRCFEESYNYIKGYKQHSTEDAQRRFNRFIEFMHREVESAGITYDKEEYDYKQKLKFYLEKHDIMTEENIAKLENVKWDSRVNGADGTSGKRSYKGKALLCGDSIEFIYHKGKKLNLNKVRMKWRTDSWGTDTFELSLKQFK